jgi:hypothetical protein
MKKYYSHKRADPDKNQHGYNQTWLTTKRPSGNRWSFHRRHGSNLDVAEGGFSATGAGIYNATTLEMGASTHSLPPFDGSMTATTELSRSFL